VGCSTIKDISNPVRHTLPPDLLDPVWLNIPELNIISPSILFLPNTGCLSDTISTVVLSSTLTLEGVMIIPHTPILTPDTFRVRDTPVIPMLRCIDFLQSKMPLVQGCGTRTIKAITHLHEWITG
jgi:hypothetical protein